ADVASRPGIVLHAVVSQEMKRDVAARAAAAGLPCMDLTGNLVEFLSAASGVHPTPDRRRLHDVDAAYRRRIGAIEFTLAHDDGLGLDTLHEADVVLVGVSRTSKSPTSIYLAQQGYKVANVSLAHQVEPPPQIMQLRRQKVAALYINPATLSEIRSRRQAGWRMETTDYNRVEAVEREVAWSRQLFRRMGWEALDVTNQAIEETAGRIVERLKLEQRGTAVDVPELA
ncbi:MAG TPA: pyruvate, phosphate dikinase/phosphoenolpyruvate synthase regulator, partial [Tepidisphaeraceae bacterium]|nr:pyruvate, phosphate dikinase/phosphoenolpyruvate synthase regulator [Tepidisphaeraceae bacterium]